MDRIGREGRETDGHVFSSFGSGSAVLDALAFPDEDAFASPDKEKSARGRDMECSPENERVFVKLRTLVRLDPSGGALHAGDADLMSAAGHPADELLYDFRLVPRRGDDGRIGEMF